MSGVPKKRKEAEPAVGTTYSLVPAGAPAAVGGAAVGQNQGKTSFEEKAVDILG